MVMMLMVVVVGAAAPAVAVYTSAGRSFVNKQLTTDDIIEIELESISNIGLEFNLFDKSGIVPNLVHLNVQQCKHLGWTDHILVIQFMPQ